MENTHKSSMDYILQLRQLIGHRPILMVGAAILVIDHTKRLLLMKRADNNCWGPPGGSTEPGERVEEAAKRETLEETGLQIDEMKLFGVFSGPELFYVYPNGDEVYNVTIVYLAELAAEDPPIILDQEHTAWGWFASPAIPADISPPMKPSIDQFKHLFPY